MYSLFKNVEEYKQQSVSELVKIKSRLNIVNVVLKVITLMAALAASITTAILVSKLVYTSGYPDWYFFMTAGVSAGTGLLTNILSFFLVSDKISNISKKLNDIEAEEVLYHNALHKKYKGKNKEFAYYLSIASILDSSSAKKEVRYA